VANGKFVGTKFNFDAGLTKKIGSSPEVSSTLTTEVDTVKMTVDGTLLTCQNLTFNFKVLLNYFYCFLY
jgi:hypothetical protein